METYCGKSCEDVLKGKRCAVRAARWALGGPMEESAKIAQCSRQKGHETCGTCAFQGSCALLRSRDRQVEYRRRNRKYRNVGKRSWQGGCPFCASALDFVLADRPLCHRLYLGQREHGKGGSPSLPGRVYAECRLFHRLWGHFDQDVPGRRAVPGGGHLHLAPCPDKRFIAGVFRWRRIDGFLADHSDPRRHCGPGRGVLRICGPLCGTCWDR